MLKYTMDKIYRIQPVQAIVHGLQQGPDDSDVLAPPTGYELFVKDGIRLRSVGIYPTESAAKAGARKHAGNDTAIFV